MQNNFSIHLTMNAWNEILARTFVDFDGQTNVSPDWLINPATKRKLKLDRFYPDAGIAIRFVGLTAKGQRRQSDWDAMETEQRDQTRVELCRVNNVQLAVISPIDEPVKQIDNFVSTLSRASRVLAQSKRPDKEKQKLMPALSKSRTQLGDLRSLINKNPEQMMANLAEAWRDREAGMVAELDKLKREPKKKRKQKTLKLATEQRVRHERFGEGVVTNLAGSGDDATLSILFDAAEERTFLLTLVSDKLETI